MAIDHSTRMQKLVDVAHVRKQRLANAAADARRRLDFAEEELSAADTRRDAAQVALHGASNSLLHDPGNDQLRIWRDHCSARKADSVAAMQECEQDRDDAQHRVSQSIRALQRQDLRHDHLASAAQKQRLSHARLQEARADDDMQGTGGKTSGPLALSGAIL